MAQLYKPCSIWYDISATDSRPSRFLMPDFGVKHQVCYYLLLASTVIKRLTLSVARSETGLLGPFFVV